MKNKKGFTLTEIIATIVILGIIIAIAVPSYTALKNKFFKKELEALEKNIVTASKTYIKDNKSLAPSRNLESSIISYKELYDNDYIKKSEKVNDNAKVVVFKKNDELIYKFCKDTTTYKERDYENNICLFGDDDKIESTYGSSTKLYLYLNNYTNEELREKLGLNKTIVRKTKDGNILYSMDDSSSDGIKYPTNITSLVTTKTGIYKVKYGSITKDVEVYVHKAPEIKIYNFDLENFIAQSEETIKMNTSDKFYLYTDNTTFGNNYDSKYLKYEYSTDNKKTWTKIICKTSPTTGNGFECNWGRLDPLLFDKTVSFRIVGEDNIGKEQKGLITTKKIENDTLLINYYTYDGKLINSSEYNNTNKNLTKLENLDMIKPSENIDFYGWSTTENSTTIIYTDGQEVDLTNSINLYAVWKKDVIANFYSGINKNKKTTRSCTYYNGSSGCNITTDTLTSAQTISNWTRLGWRDDTDADTNEYKYNKTISLSKDTDFYCIYKRTLTISYDGNGASSGSMLLNSTKNIYLNSNGTQTSDQTIDLKSNNYQKTNYSWVCWSTSETSKNCVNSPYNPNISYESSFSKRLYAYWEPIKYTLSLELNGGGFNDSQTPTSFTKEYNTSFEIPQPYKNEYKFEGWYNSSDIKVSNPYTIIENTTLYAKWSKTLTQTFNVGKAKWMKYADGWNNNESINIICTLYNDKESCEITTPSLNNVSGENRKSETIDNTISKENQKYSSLFTVNGWKLKNKSDLLNQNSKQSFSSNNEYEGSVTFNYINRTFSVFANDELGLYCRSDVPGDEGSIYTGIIKAGVGDNATFKATEWAYCESKYCKDMGYTIWLKGTSNDCGKSDDGKFTEGCDEYKNNCKEKWIPAAWVSW